MTERADAVVIGAGILGSSVAHFLTNLGYGDVVLLDKGAVCSGSTQYSAANVRQHYYSAFGGSGHCFEIGPPIGEALADVIAGREPAIDISPLRHARFAQGDTFTSVWGPGNRA